MTASPGHISARLLVQFVELARRHGLDVAALCEEAGLELATLYEPEARIPYASLITHTNALFLSFFEERAQAKVAQLAPTSSLLEQVRTVLRRALAGGDYSLAAVATTLHMSPRTLQRRLKEEGSRHEALLDGLRHDLARVCLEKRLSISEISFLLGYSNPTTFHRAFKRWTGSSPEHYRAHSGVAAGSPALAVLDGQPG